MLRNAVIFSSLISLLVVSLSLRAEEDVAPLKDGEGYLLVGISMNRIYFESIKLDGGGSLFYAHTFDSDDLNEAVNYELIKLPEGRYFWKFIMLANNRRYEFGKKEFPMTVEAGRVNYGGLFFGEQLERNRSYFKLLNRATTAIKIAEERYPDLLARYPMRYGAPGDDPFVDYYFSLPPREDPEE